MFNIERYAIHDGPGIRTVVFLKGCPLLCRWCANPEGQTSSMVLGLLSDSCVHCGKCLDVCPSGAIARTPEGKITTDRLSCSVCGRCVEACPSGARALFGQTMSIERVMNEVMRDEDYYRNSGGGVTLSGGDPALQSEFSQAILRECRNRRVHTTIETCGQGPWDVMRELIELTDLLLYDVKHMDPHRHLEGTGSSNAVILQNARNAARTGIPMIVRVPVVPGFNDAEDDIGDIIRFVRELGSVREVHFLPYHELGVAKYGRLGQRYPFGRHDSSKADSLQRYCALAESQGLTTRIDG